MNTTTMPITEIDDVAYGIYETFQTDPEIDIPVTDLNERVKQVDILDDDPDSGIVIMEMRDGGKFKVTVEKID